MSKNTKNKETEKPRRGFVKQVEEQRKKARTLHNTNQEEAKENIPDIRVTGNPSAWVTIAKASSEKEGWMKSTKAMEITGEKGGVVLQVTTREEVGVAEALCFIPQGKITKDAEGNYKVSA